MKILMATMGLNIGGAETHIVELSKALAARGYEITVISSGGVYEKELTDAGIRCLRLPLNRPSPKAMLCAERGLCRLFRQEKFDAVHAHARIPAFLCGFALRGTGIPLVTTAHYTFTLSPLKKLLSNWGEASLAVSCGIKDYLIEAYGIPSGRISLTVNGIDLHKFSPAVRGDRIVQEFGLSPSCPHRIVYVSRLEDYAAKAGVYLLDLALELQKKFPSLEIVIAGAGGLSAEFEKRAAEINRIAGRKLVTLTGARTDIPEIVAAGTVFLGVSRAALEAMAEEKPVVLAGPQGFLGIWDESKLESAISSNFCCLNGDYSAEDERDALISLLSASEEERHRIGVSGRETVLRNYTTDRMADDAEKLYRSVLYRRNQGIGEQKRQGIVISGYYGYRNNGDDVILHKLLSELRHLAPELPVTVLSRRPRETERIYGVRAVNRFSVHRVIPAMKRASLVISGGGTLLTDITSSRSLAYYAGILRLAKQCGCKTMIYGSGIGPFSREKNKLLARDVLLSADAVTLRERSSLRYLTEMSGIPEGKAAVSADPVFLPSDTAQEWLRYRREKAGLSANTPYFCVSVRNYRHSNPKHFRSELLSAILYLKKKTGCIPVFVSMQDDRDLPLSRYLCEKTGGILLPSMPGEELISFLSGSEFLLGMRLHSLLYAILAGTLPVCLSYDPKIDALAEELSLPAPVQPSEMTASVIISHTEALLSDREHILSLLSSYREKKSALAKSDVSLAISLAQE